jgi:hypothetical protein
MDKKKSVLFETLYSLLKNKLFHHKISTDSGRIEQIEVEIDSLLERIKALL